MYVFPSTSDPSTSAVCFDHYGSGTILLLELTRSHMQVAAKIHQPAIFNFLLSIGMDEHSPDENQKTAATTVMTRRRSEEYALPIDADDLAHRLGWTALHKAAALAQGVRQMTESLLESEFGDINCRDALGRTPRHWLAETGQVDAIRLLT